jgi:hypothetical protein
MLIASVTQKHKEEPHRLAYFSCLLSTAIQVLCTRKSSLASIQLCSLQFIHAKVLARSLKLNVARLDGPWDTCLPLYISVMLCAPWGWPICNAPAASVCPLASFWFAE